MSDFDGIDRNYYEDNPDIDGDVFDLLDDISAGDVLSVFNVGDRDADGHYSFLDITLTDNDTGEDRTYRLEFDQLSQEMLDYIAEYADEEDAYVNPAYGLGEG